MKQQYLSARTISSPQLVLLFSALFCLVACQQIVPPSETVATVAPEYGDAVDIGGQSIFLYCTGEGSPTVMLEAGLGGDHTTWTAVQAEVAKFTHVCSYDRVNAGTSERTPKVRTSADVVDELHRLLSAAEIDGPLVLVAHSFGALHARLFAETYPEAVKGLVLVDPVHEDWWKRAAALLPPERKDEGSVAELRRYWQSEGGAPEENSERIDIAASLKQARAARTPMTIPVIILTAGIPDLLPAGLPDDLYAALVHLLQTELPADLATLSPNSMRLTVPNSGHDIPRSQPAVVVAAVKTLVELKP